MSGPEKALARLAAAAIVVADILDSGERDPTWHESQELEEAAISYGRAVRNSTASTGNAGLSEKPPSSPARSLPADVNFSCAEVGGEK